MAEAIRDLVVSISLQTDKFTKNISALNKQIHEVESYFKEASAGVDNFENTTNGLATKVAALNQKMDLQRNIVDQYGKALDAARTHLAECYANQNKYSQLLADAKQKQADLKDEVERAAAAYENYKNTLGANSSAAIAAQANLDTVKREYAESSDAVAKLAGQYERVQNQTLTAANSVTTHVTALNNAKAVMNTTEAAINATNKALDLSKTNWQSAGDAIKTYEVTISTIGRDIQIATSGFEAAAAEMDDINSSSVGLAMQLDMLTKKLDLQQQVVTQYEGVLASSKEQLSAALSVGDADKIQQATDAVKRAEIALNGAKKKVAETKKEINDSTKSLNLISAGWNEASAAFNDSQSAIQGISREMRIAESEFKAATAGIDGTNDSIAMLAAKLELVGTKFAMQQQIVAQYQKSLSAAKQELAAAQAAGDTDKIDDANRAIAETEEKLASARAELEQYGAALEAIGKELDVASSKWTSAGSALTEFSEKLSTTGQKTQQVGTQITNVLSKRVLSFGKSVLQSSIEFESSFAGVRKTVNATEAEFDSLEQKVKEMSEVTGVTTNEINEVLATAGQLGVHNDALMDFTETMIKLGVSAEDLSANEAATELAKFANIMGTSQTEFDKMGAAVTALGNNFATTEKPIIEMARRLAGAGKQVGMTEAQVLGVATALSSVGIEAQMGGSAFSKALINMEVAVVNGGEKLEDFARVSGMTAEQFTNTWNNDPVQAFQAFINGLAKLDDEGISAIATLDEIGISEIRLRDTMLRTVNANELFAEAQQLANQAWEEGTALNEEANKRFQTTENRIKAIQNAFNNFKIALGDALAPAIQTVMEALSDFVQRLKGLDINPFVEMANTAAKVIGDLMKKLEGMSDSSIIFFSKLLTYTALLGPALTAVGKFEKGLGTVFGVIGKFSTSMGTGVGVMKSFTAALGPAGVAGGVVALSAALAIGLVKLVDYASGAAAAREAVDSLKKTAQDWANTVSDTFYDKSEGLAHFGITFDEDDSTASAEKMAQDWLDGLITVWTDGALETDEIRDTWINSFKEMTNGTREELESMQAAAEENGQSGIVEELQTSIDELNAMDEEVDALLHKRQNGFLTDEETSRLEEILGKKHEIELKYQLVTDGGSAYEQMTNAIENAKKRAQASMGEDWETSPELAEEYENAIVGAAEAFSQANSVLDEQYDKQRAIVDAIEDQTEREAALDELNKQYIADQKAAAEEYVAFLSEPLKFKFNDSDTQQAKSTLDELTKKLADFSQASEGDKTTILTEMAEIGKSLDETSLTEYYAMLTQIKDLIDSGVLTEEDVSGILGDGLNVDTALQQLASLKEFTSEYSEDLAGLDSMLGTLGENVEQIAVKLNLDQAKQDWAEFAENPGAITTTATITGFDVDPNTRQPNTSVIVTGYSYDAAENLKNENPELGINGVQNAGLALGLDTSKWAEQLAGAVKAFNEEGHEIPVDIAIANMVATGEGNVAFDADGNMIVQTVLNITGTKEAVDDATDKMEENLDGAFGLGSGWMDYLEEKFGDTFDLSNFAVIDRAIENIKAYMEGGPLNELLGKTSKDSLEHYFDVVFNPEKLSEISVWLGEITNAIGNGEGVSDDNLANFQKLIDLISLLQETDVGGNVTSTLVSGLENAGITTTTDNIVQTLTTLYDSAITAGQNVSLGLGEGIAEDAWAAGDEATNLANVVIDDAMSTLQENSPSRVFMTIGRNVSAGLANGIRAGKSGVVAAIIETVQAAIAAAKEEFEIASPSRVFRDEIGAMAMKGLGLGIKDQLSDQEKVIRNASRYLTNAASSGVSLATSNTNNSYSYNNPVDFSGSTFYIRDEQDVHDLAIEIAALTRRQQRGKGMRFA